MAPRSPRRRVAVLLVALAALLAPQLASAQSLEDARRERAAIQERLDAAAADLAEVEARIGALSDETAELDEEMARLEATAAEAEARVAERIRDLYKRGIDVPMLQVLGADDAQAAFDRAEMAGHLLAADAVVVEAATAARTRASEVAEVLEHRRAELDEALAEQQAVLDGLGEDLERAKQLEEQLEAEERERQAEARRRAEAAAARRRAEAQAAVRANGGYACPVSQPRSFTDTWGAARSGGRSHKGTDILNPYGNEVIAIVSGTWDVRSYGSLSGHWGLLRGVDGHSYYYMHLQEHLVGDGARVSAGQVVALNGDTGNARGTPHVHFEYHPGGSGAVNPYPLLKSLCG